MKQFLLLLTFILSFTSRAADIREMSLHSFMNYGMAAMFTKVHEDGKIQVVLESAILSYPDNFRGFESFDKLSKAFELEGLNAISITFENDACSINSDNDAIFDCRAYSYRNITTAKIEGVVVDRIMGRTEPKILKKSEKIFFDNHALVTLGKVTRTNTHSTQSSFEARVSLTVDKKLNFYTTKSHLGIDRSFDL